MDMGSLVGTRLRTALNYKRDPMSAFQGLLLWQILTVAHTKIMFRGLKVWVQTPV